MPLPEQVDLDKLMGIILDCERKALNGWLAGVPRDETAFMNQLTGQLTRTRRGCDVGLTERFVAITKVTELHRRSSDSSDLFGSDLGITICVGAGEEEYTKTALFQVKVGNGFSAKLERHQLETASASAAVKDRSFVLYLDEGRGTIKITTASELLKGWPASQKEKTFATTKWESVSKWTTNWLSCDVGPISDLADSESIERRLERYEVITAPVVRGEDEPADELAWLRFAFLPEGLDIAGTPFKRLFNGRGR